MAGGRWGGRFPDRCGRSLEASALLAVESDARALRRDCPEKPPESWTLLLHGLDVLVAREYPLANAIRDLD